MYEGGVRLHEVPFAMAWEGQVVRGTIDCLISHPDGAFTVLEFKTGRARPEHGMQLQIYKRAVEGMAPGARVDAWLVYPDVVIAA